MEQMMTLNEHERREWSRCAVAMYARNLNANGTALSVAAAVGTIPTHRFTYCAAIYRAWLVFYEPKGEQVHGGLCAQRFHGAAECDCGVADGAQS